MRKLFADGYNLVDHLLTAVARCGYWLDPGTRILDFGCGAGGLVYDLRERGFDARGFDIHDYVKYRSPEDRELFCFSANAAMGWSDHRIDRATFRIPHDDRSFDLIRRRVDTRDALGAFVGDQRLPVGLVSRLLLGLRARDELLRTAGEAT